jgi:cytochrome bd-type quinol oxidase subunit 2
VSDAAGTGEQHEQARRTRKAWILGGAFATGLVAGILVGIQEGENIFVGSDADGWPPALAIGLVLSYLVVVVLGGLALARQTDEFELQRQYKAVSAAAFVYAIAYPVWFTLWMGQLAPEPMHGALFILFWLSLLAAFLFYRFR